MSRRVGRPRKPRKELIVPIGISVDPDTLSRLDEMQTYAGERSAIVRRLIAEGYERWKESRQA